MLLINLVNSVYPFISLTIIPKSIISNMALLIPDLYNLVYVTLIKCSPNYFFMVLIGKSTISADKQFYGFFLSSDLLLIDLNCSDLRVKGKLILNKLPLNTASCVNNFILLDRSTYIYYKPDITITKYINFTGALSVVVKQALNSILVYRNLNPGYFLNGSNDPNNKLIGYLSLCSIKAINDFDIASKTYATYSLIILSLLPELTLSIKESLQILNLYISSGASYICNNMQ